MTCGFFAVFSTRFANLSIRSTYMEFVSIFLSIFDTFRNLVERIDQFIENAELETQIKANLEGLGL